jgi:3-hydroxyacyl-[acyl-carrier-protein] dehydratase
MRRDIEQGLISWGSGGELQALSGTFRFDEGLEVFKGHFPEMPVLPGVMQIEMVRFLAEQGTGCVHRILRVKKAKFTGQILPGDLVHLTMTMEMQEVALRVKARLKVDGKDVGSIVLDLASAMHGGTGRQSRS